MERLAVLTALIIGCDGNGCWGDGLVSVRHIESDRGEVRAGVHKLRGCKAHARRSRARLRRRSRAGDGKVLRHVVKRCAGSSSVALDCVRLAIISRGVGIANDRHGGVDWVDLLPAVHDVKDDSLEVLVGVYKLRSFQTHLRLARIGSVRLRLSGEGEVLRYVIQTVVSLRSIAADLVLLPVVGGGAGCAGDRDRGVCRVHRQRPVLCGHQVITDSLLHAGRHSRSIDRRNYVGHIPRIRDCAGVGHGDGEGVSVSRFQSGRGKASFAQRRSIISFAGVLCRDGHSLWVDGQHAVPWGYQVIAYPLLHAGRHSRSIDRRNHIGHIPRIRDRAGVGHGNGESVGIAGFQRRCGKICLGQRLAVVGLAGIFRRDGHSLGLDGQLPIHGLGYNVVAGAVPRRVQRDAGENHVVVARVRALAAGVDGVREDQPVHIALVARQVLLRAVVGRLPAVRCQGHALRFDCQLPIHSLGHHVVAGGVLGRVHGDAGEGHGVLARVRALAGGADAVEGQPVHAAREARHGLFLAVVVILAAAGGQRHRRRADGELHRRRLAAVVAVGLLDGRLQPVVPGVCGPAARRCRAIHSSSLALAGRVGVVGIGHFAIAGIAALDDGRFGGRLAVGPAGDAHLGRNRPLERRRHGHHLGRHGEGPCVARAGEGHRAAVGVPGCDAAEGVVVRRVRCDGQCDGRAFHRLCGGNAVYRRGHRVVGIRRGDRDCNVIGVAGHDCHTAHGGFERVGDGFVARGGEHRAEAAVVLLHAEVVRQLHRTCVAAGGDAHARPGGVAPVEGDRAGGRVGILI